MRRSVGNYHRTKQRAIPSDRSSDESDCDDTSDSNHPTPQLARGLSETNFKQLLTDIEEAGGIGFFSFGKICKEKPEIYGNPDSALRSQFRNKLRSLRSYNSTDYQLVLGQYNVKSCRIAARPQLVSPEKTKTPSKASSQTPSETTTTGIMAPSTPSSRSRAHITSPPASRGRLAMRDSFEDTADDVRPELNAVVIDVDVAHPSNNREVVIYNLIRVEHENSLYDCFDIYLPADVRDVLAEKLKARLISDREILITMPSLPYSFCQDTDARNLRLKAFGTHYPHTQIAQDITINNMESSGIDEYGMVKHLLLRFPSYCVLANIFQNGSKDLDLMLEMDWDHYDKDNDRAIATPTHVKWRVADQGAASRHKLKAASKTALSKVTAQLQRMSTSSKNNVPPTNPT